MGGVPASGVRRDKYSGRVHSYRLVFPASPDAPIEKTVTAFIETDEFYEVGAEIVHGGKRWRVSQAPVEQPEYGQVADLMVWPAE